MPPAETAIVLPGGANALWWDAAAATLYLTDSNASALMTWTDAGGFQLASAVPAGPAGVSLGGIVRRPDGAFVVASFGFGTEGGMFAVARGAATALTGLDPARRRVGLAQDSEGALYSVYFVGMRGTAPSAASRRSRSPGPRRPRPRSRAGSTRRSCPSPSDNYTIVAESAQLVQSRAQRVE
jgi:hypothetical protein